MTNPTRDTPAERGYLLWKTMGYGMLDASAQTGATPEEIMAEFHRREPEQAAETQRRANRALGPFAVFVALRAGVRSLARRVTRR